MIKQRKSLTEKSLSRFSLFDETIAYMIIYTVVAAISDLKPSKLHLNPNSSRISLLSFSVMTTQFRNSNRHYCTRKHQSEHSSD